MPSVDRPALDELLAELRRLYRRERAYRPPDPDRLAALERAGRALADAQDVAAVQRATDLALRIYDVWEPEGDRLLVLAEGVLVPDPLPPQEPAPHWTKRRRGGG